MPVLTPGTIFQFHLTAPMMLNQVPIYDHSIGEEVQQSIPANAIRGRVEEADETLVRVTVLTVVQAQETAEIHYSPPSYFQTAVLSVANIIMAYPVDEML